MRKGKFQYGKTGTGKTTMMSKDFAGYVVPERWAKRLLDAVDLEDIALDGGSRAVRELAGKFTEIFLDDIGDESLTVTHFGTVFSPVKEFIKARYRAQTESPEMCCTHFTSNLSPVLIGERYGAYILSRLIEMCDFVEVDGPDLRK